MTDALIVIKIGFVVKPSVDKLIIKKYTYEFKPKEKFVRKHDRYKSIGKEILAEYDISIPFAIVKEKKSRSLLGNGLQNDDINCHEEWEEDVKIYDKTKLKVFIKEKLRLHI